MSRRLWIGISIFALLVLTAAGLAYFKGYRINRPSPPVNTTSNTTESNQSPAQPAEHSVKVFFTKAPDSVDDPTKLFAVTRTTTNPGVGTFAIDQLIKGPSQSEKAAGYMSDVSLKGDSNCGGNDFKLTIDSGTATLQFCRQLEHIGSMSDARAEQQIRQTLTQFSTVSKVVILDQAGDCEFNLSGLNRCKQ